MTTENIQVKKTSVAGSDALVKKWYVLRAISGKEKKVKLHIESEVNRLKLQQYLSQVLIPMEKYIQIKNGKKVNKERSYFPGYVLIEAALVGELPHVLKGIPGVIASWAVKRAMTLYRFAPLKLTVFWAKLMSFRKATLK